MLRPPCFNPTRPSCSAEQRLSATRTMTSLTDNMLSFVETREGESRPSAPPYGYTWADENPYKVKVGADGEPATRWPVALQVDAAK